MSFTRSGEAAALQLRQRRIAILGWDEVDALFRRLSAVAASALATSSNGRKGDAVMQNIQRREFITKSSAAIAGLAALYATRRAYAFPSQPGEEVVRWLDQPAPIPFPK